MDKRELDGLMRSVQSGDENSFVVIYESLYKNLYSFVYSILGDRSYVDDLVQETFIRVRKNVQSYKPGTNAGAWIFQIAKNLCYDFLRKESKTSFVEVEKINNFAAEVDSPLLRLELHELLIENLDEKSRTIVVLHAVEGYKNREIAQILGLPLGTVLWKYNQAMKVLKQKLKEVENEKQSD